MKFEEIFNEEGLYRAESFAEGVCFEIKKNSLNDSLELFLKTYKDKDDLLPRREIMLVYADLFKKEYTKVFTRKSLFNK